ncbi:hypothetical protein [Methanosarcina mazei]|jgi:hypothetical protein|nr:hypothetical protein [Methanosarcina mazei]
MVEDGTQAMQRNVEKDLFDEQSKILDRFIFADYSHEIKKE